MAFCTNCGKPLREGGKFCFYCGSAVAAEGSPPQRGAEREESVGTAAAAEAAPTPAAVSEPGPAAKKPNILSAVTKRGWLIIAIAALAVTAAAVVIAALSKPKLAEYYDPEVFFTLKYPDNLMVTEPYSQGVIFTDSDEPDMQISCEYAVCMVNGSIIYSAKDFYNQASENPGVIRDWLGAEDASISAGVEDTLNGQGCYVFDFELDNGGHRTGQFIAVEGKGDLGCYTVLWQVNEDSAKAKKYLDICRQAVSSFTVCGAFAPTDMEGYLDENLGFYALLPKGNVAKSAVTASASIIYPVESIYSDCNIAVYSTTYPLSSTAEEILEHQFEFTSGRFEDVCMTLSPTKAGLGRYDYTVMELSYYYDCTLKTETYAVFPAGDHYWKIEADAADEYYDTAMSCMQDLMNSIIILN